ncbi:YgaP family membrane protein [Halobacillus mangrovi]|uniref:YgaP family membrane protein n=1 Tax=Halobacillus mangrovi TaxID=402384 RepID=UPI003D950C5B
MIQNIGIINSMVRITAGLSMLTFLSMQGQKQEDSFVQRMMVIIAAMKVAEGIVRYCPMTAMYDEIVYEDDGIEEDWDQEFTEEVM